MIVKNQKKIALFYPCFAGGGAEAVALWMMQALSQKYEITLFTIGKVDFKKLDLMYGTSLVGQRIKIASCIPMFLSYICYLLIANNNFLRNFFFHLCIRHLKLNCHNYDLVMSAYNGVDLGKKGIQYIHWINVLETNALISKISNFEHQQIQQNISLANSYFVAEESHKKYGVNAQVVYPPVVIEPLQVDWEAKENAFICSGRIVKAKEPHRVIKILEKVRAQGFDIKLYMTGGGGGIYGWKYQQLMNKLLAKNSSWVTLYNNLPYPEYVNLLSKCRYGIHFKKEPFGISIAEMVKAGAIPFVRSVGGQIEIIGDRNQDLFFSSEDEAVERIIQVLSNIDKQQELIDRLKAQQDMFSTEKFMSQISTVVDDYFSSSVQLTNQT